MKPILFNTEMVRAILDGRKTVTRRKIITDISNQFDCEADGTPIAFIEQSTGDHYKPTDPCKYQPRDILYVRETFADTWTPGDDTGYVYKADGQPNSFPYWGNASTYKDEVWRPSRHMPKKAARIFLRVKEVRVERLHDISEEQATREGCKKGDQYLGENSSSAGTAKQSFMWLWKLLYDIGDYPWISDPWVWVIEFEQISKEEALKG